MLKKLNILFVLASAIMSQAGAQSPSEGGAANPVSRIESESNGNVEIDIPTQILDLLIKEDRETTRKETPALRPGINKLQGFRIQVFSDGRNQHSLESRARARGNAIVARFPQYRGQVYSYSSAPNWYTRIGNFQTQAEASQALAALKSAFPQFAAEMRVVRSQIVVIK